MSDIISKIAKVLNQAENASTKEEADAFLSMAQNLSTRYSVDLAVARATTQKNQRRETPERRVVDVDNFGRNAKKHMVKLYSAIANNNDVRIDIASDSATVYPYGFPSDLDVTEALFVHLAAQMVETSNTYIESGVYKTETERRYSPKHYSYVDRPIDGRVARSNFYIAFIREIRNRLFDAKQEAMEAIKAEESYETSGTELALIDKTKEVNDLYKATSTARGSWKGASVSGYSRSARSAGQSAGQSARLSGQGSLNGGRQAINA